MGKVDSDVEEESVSTYHQGSTSTIIPVGSLETSPVSSGGRGALRQWLAGGVASLAMWALGSGLGWSAPSVPEIEDGKGISGVTKEEISWVASIVMLAALPGCFLGGYLVDRLGRRPSMMLLAFLTLGGWALVALAQNAWMLILGRAWIGLISGAMCVCPAVYIPEMAEDYLRSRIVSWNVVALCLGIVYTYLIGAVTTWRWNTVISGVTPVFLIVGVYFLPETPRYLLTRGKRGDASKALQWFRAQNEREVEDELQRLEASIAEMGDTSGATEVMEKRWGASTIKPVLISVSCAAFCQLSGTTAVTFYTVDIFEAAGSSIDANVATILVGTTQAIATAFAGFLMTRFGRRPLFVFSEAGMGVSLTILGAFYFYDKENPEGTEAFRWVPLFSLVAFTITYCCGAGILPWALMADLCPPHVKGVTSAICTGMNCGLGFLVALLFPRLLDGVGGYGAFWMFAGINAVGTVYMALVLPETKDKTMEEIQALFKS